MDPDNKNAELIALLSDLRDENRSQKELLARQHRQLSVLAVLAACLLAAALLSLFILLPRMSRTLTQLDEVLVNSEEITSQLAEADLEGTVASLKTALTSVSDVLEECSDSLSVTLQNLEEMDIATLNRAIEDLYSVIDPIASLFGR